MNDTQGSIFSHTRRRWLGRAALCAPFVCSLALAGPALRGQEVIVVHALLVAELEQEERAWAATFRDPLIPDLIVPTQMQIDAPNRMRTVAVPAPERSGSYVLMNVLRQERLLPRELLVFRNLKAPEPQPVNLLSPTLAASELVDMLGHADPRVHSQAAQLLLAKGDEGVSALRSACEASLPQRRGVALMGLTRAALDRMQPDLPGEVCARLDEALLDPSPEVRQRAAAAMGWLGADPEAYGKVALQGLLSRMGDENELVRAQTCRALARLGEPAVVPLLDLLTSRDEKLQHTASTALGLLGAQAVPPLVARLEHASAQVRYAAATALGDIGPPAAKALEPLRRLAKSDPDANVRYYANAAVQKIR